MYFIIAFKIYKTNLYVPQGNLGRPLSYKCYKTMLVKQCQQNKVGKTMSEKSMLVKQCWKTMSVKQCRKTMSENNVRKQCQQNNVEKQCWQNNVGETM